MKQAYLVVVNTLRHAMIIHANSNEELFNAIDEFTNPYCCLIKEFDGLNICFSTDVVLDARDGDIDIGDLIGVADGVEPEIGDYAYEALADCGDEIRKIRNEIQNLDTEWMTFNNNHKDLIPFTHHKEFTASLIENINNLPLTHTHAGSTTENIIPGNDPDEMPSIFEKAMTMLLKNPQGITHLDVGCNSDDLGAIMFAVQNGYLEQLNAEARKEVTH